MSIKDKYVVKSIDSKDTYEWFLNKHYAGRIPNIIYSFGLYKDNILEGVLSYGMTANNNLNEVVEGYRTLELNRLVVNEGLEKNTLSFFVSQTLKKLPNPLIIISYADTTHGHHGYIYQATNWIYTGLGKGDYEFIKNGKQYHRKNIYDLLGTGSIENAEKHGYRVVKVNPKHRYIYILASKKEKDQIYKKLKFKREEYPKGDNKRYNTDYNTSTQLKIF